MEVLLAAQSYVDEPERDREHHGAREPTEGDEARAAPRVVPAVRDDRRAQRERNRNEIQRPVDAGHHRGTEQEPREARDRGPRRSRAGQEPETAEQHGLRGELRERVAHEVHLDEVGRERGQRGERDPRPHEARRERVEAQQPDAAEDRRREEHEPVAAEPAGLGEQGGKQVRELEVEAPAAAVEDGSRRVAQARGLRERADPRVELEVVVGGHPPPGEQVATRIAVEEHVLGVVADGERRGACRGHHREERRELRVAVVAPRDLPGRNGDDHRDRGDRSQREGRHRQEHAGDREREPDRPEAEDRGEHRHQADGEPGWQRLGTGVAARRRARRGRRVECPGRHRPGSFARAAGPDKPLRADARLPLSPDGRARGLRDATYGWTAWVNE